ncbi:type IV pilin [Betaproteobacteria bacterium]|nr:type IV pilin [Betaproteobacteria bacterium]
MKNRQLAMQQGFTLVELMIVVLIVAILSAVALPSYRNYVMKTKRAECEGVLLTGAAMFERHYAANNTFATTLTLQCPQDGGTTSYVITGNTGTASDFKIIATPDGGQENDDCGVLAIDEKGKKYSNGSDSSSTVAKCWK